MDNGITPRITHDDACVLPDNDWNKIGSDQPSDAPIVVIAPGEDVDWDWVLDQPETYAVHWI